MPCIACVHRRPANIPGVLARHLGPQWWKVESVPHAQAEMAASLSTDGMCDHHAWWWVDLAGHAIRTEIATRALLPGSVDVWYVTIDEDPYEEIARDRMMGRRGRAVVDRVRAFVASSCLSAVVEIDPASCRARVRLLLGESDPPTTAVLGSDRLAHTTAQEIVDALRMRRVGG